LENNFSFILIFGNRKFPELPLLGKVQIFVSLLFFETSLSLEIKSNCRFKKDPFLIISNFLLIPSIVEKSRNFDPFLCKCTIDTAYQSACARRGPQWGDPQARRPGAPGPRGPRGTAHGSRPYRGAPPRGGGQRGPRAAPPGRSGRRPAAAAAGAPTPHSDSFTVPCRRAAASRAALPPAPMPWFPGGGLTVVGAVGNK